MRLNKFVAEATGVSRREADKLIDAGSIEINGAPSRLGQQVSDSDIVELEGKRIQRSKYEYVLLNKPPGYVCSRKQQDEKPTIYELLPDELNNLKPAGRLDADSRGLLLLTNDGDYANELTHPRNHKAKSYIVKLDKELSSEDRAKLSKGVELEDGISRLQVAEDGQTITMHEGRNRQIRRTFDAIGYTVVDLQRTSFGPYDLAGLKQGSYAPTAKKSL